MYEVCICKDIIDIFEKNRSFVLRRLKKYMVEEYEQEQEKLKKMQEAILEALKYMCIKNNNLNRDVVEGDLMIERKE